MRWSQVWMRRTVIVVLALAVPAFALVAFEGLVRGGNETDRPHLIERAWHAPANAAKSLKLFVSGQKISAAAGSARAGESTGNEVNLPVLVYHNVRDKEAAKPPGLRPYDITPAEFDAQMAYLEKNGYTSVSFGDLESALDGGKHLPPKPVLITLDDGRESQWQDAYPSLLRHHLTATFFVFTNAVGHDKYFTWEQLKEMQANGMDVQSHTVYHPYLTKADDATLRKEMERSKASIEKNLGTKVIAVAYPFGLHDARVDAAAKAAGYLFARTLNHVTRIGSADHMNVPGYITTGDIRNFPRILSGEK